MTTTQRRLCRYGLGLFLCGLLLGFALPAFANRPLASGAHEAALGAGTFLIALTVLWPELRCSERASSLLAHALALSLFGLVLGLTLLATLGARQDDSLVRSAGMLFNLGSSVVMLASVAALFVSLRASPR